MTTSNYILWSLVLVAAATSALASNGDRTQFFQNCRQNCERTNCSADGLEIQEQAVKYYQQTVFDKTLHWTCADECQYGCMWRTVDAFLERGWEVPQFYGKWPFVRFLGLQEPASVVFSLLNLLAHYRNFRRFRKEIRSDSPCYKLWQVFSLVNMNGWVWSTVFHARDFPLTELFDYAFAYSIILVTLYCFVMRLLHNWSVFLRGLVSLGFLGYYVNYFAYLSIGRFSYSLNMTMNVVTGLLSGVGWILFYFMKRKQRPYAKKILRFYVLFMMALSLELLDFPPAFWVMDAHALWHLATAFLINLFYSFVIDDCKALRMEKMGYSEVYNKNI